MISHDPTVAGNIRHLQREIRKTGNAPLGPVALTPGEGHIRLNDGTNDTGFLDFNGMQLRYRGGLRGLTELTESFANSIEAHTNLLSEHAGRLDGHDSTLASHNTRITNAQSRADAAHSNAATAQARADSAWTRAGTGISNAATAQARADSAWTRAGTGIANAATAKSRADSAHTRIDGLSYASPAQIAQLNDQIQDLRGRVKALENWRASLPQG